MAIAYSGLTHPGRVRLNNEDAWQVDPDLCLAVLADGMGGHACGEVGSALTVDGVIFYFRQPPEPLQPEQLVKEAVRHANRRVRDAAKAHPECANMGSTVVLAHWSAGGLIVANVGDSRAYLCRDGRLRQLSCDQNVAADLRARLGFSEEQIQRVPARHALTMAVGGSEHVLVLTHAEAFEDGDELLLCSDGLHGPVGDAMILEVLAARATLEEKLQKLVDSANAAGGPDNITAVLLEYRTEGL
jgi:PPM family protein phosphatase